MSRLTVAEAIARVQAVYGRWRRDTPVSQMRQDWDALFGARLPDIRIEPVDADGVPCQWVMAPGSSADRVVVYLHGGGFQVGSLVSHAELMARISATTGAHVLGVGYRLAPEHPYPAALEDSVAAYDWLRRQGVQAGQIAIAGDSAGGGLGLALLLALHQRAAGTYAAAYWGMSAWTDLTASGDSYETRAHLDPIHQRPMIKVMARGYLGETGDARDPLASPLFAPANQLAALPPMLLQVGARETIVSDSEGFAQKAAAAGASVQVQVWPDMIHVFQQFSGLEQADQALDEGGRFVAGQFDLNATGRSGS